MAFFKSNRHQRLNFYKTSNKKRKTVTKVQKKQQQFTAMKTRGLLHKLNNFTYLATRKLPSFSVTLSSVKPKTNVGKAAKAVTKGAYKTVKFTAKATVNTALFAEKALLFTSDIINPKRQAQLSFSRVKRKNGKYKTKVRIYYKDKPTVRHNGVIRESIDFIRNAEGDVPSLTKKLNSFKPKTGRGQIALGAAKGTYNFVKATNKTLETASLAAEGAVITAGDHAVRHFKRKLHESSMEDSSKAILKTTSMVSNAFTGTERYLKARQEFKQEKDTLRSRKSERRFTTQSNNKYLLSEKKDFRSKKKSFQADKRSFKRSRKTTANRTKFKQQKKQFKEEKKEYRKNKKLVHSANKMLKKREKNQRRIKNLKKPEIQMQLSSAYWNKLQSNVSENNDVAKVITTSVNKVGSFLRENKANELARAEKKKDKLEKQSNKKQAQIKLNQYNKAHGIKTSKAKTKRKPHFKWDRWRKKYGYDENKTADENVKEVVKNVFKRVGYAAGSAVGKALIFLIPIMAVLLCISIAFNAAVSVFESGSFIMGTYTAKDDALSEAVTEYTGLAKKLNQQVIRCGNNTDWKNALKIIYNNRLMDSSCRNPHTQVFRDTPTEFDFENTGSYDFDPFVLWSFLCAYNYDFEESERAKADGRTYKPNYWTFNGTSKNAVKELFTNEYAFTYKYDNSSYWEKLSSYTYFGGGNSSGRWTYYSCDNKAYKNTSSSSAWKYKFRLNQAPSQLWDYADSYRYCYLNSNYRVLDAKNDYRETGFYILDTRFYADSSHTVEPFYWVDSGGSYFFRNHDGNNEYRHFNAFYGDSSGEDTWFMIPQADVISLTGDSSSTALYGCVEKYRYKTNCRLTYDVKRKRSFVNAAKAVLNHKDHAAERKAYFNLLIGEGASTKLRGNHQLICSPIKNADMKILIENDRVYNGFGYDVEKWNKVHCWLGSDKSNGIDLVCSSSDEIISPINGKVTSITGNSITIQSEKIDMWYEEDKTSRNVMVTIQNANLSSSRLSIGSVVEKGKKLGKGRSGSKLHVETQLYYGPRSRYVYVDPRLLIE